MKNLSLSVLRFGSEEDFKMAITELEWIIETFGKATKRDFEAVSSKYNFPIGFLKQGLKGLTFPDDYKISRSRWYPILYSWAIQSKKVSDGLFRLQIDYLSSRHSFIRTFAILIGVSQVLTLFLKDYFMLDLLSLSLLIITFVLFFIGLYFEMKNHLSGKKIALDECRYLLRQKGLEKMVEENEEFVKRHYKFFSYAGNIMKKKIESGLQITIFASHVEDGKLILDDWEDPVSEYRKRISELGSKCASR